MLNATKLPVRSNGVHTTTRQILRCKICKTLTQTSDPVVRYRWRIQAAFRRPQELRDALPHTIIARVQTLASSGGQSTVEIEFYAGFCNSRTMLRSRPYIDDSTTPRPSLITLICENASLISASE